MSLPQLTLPHALLSCFIDLNNLNYMPLERSILAFTRRTLIQARVNQSGLTYLLCRTVALALGLALIGCQTTPQGPQQDTARHAAVERAIEQIPQVEAQNFHIYCLGQRTFIIGAPRSSEQANAILLAADKALSNHTVEAYLPLSSSHADTKKDASITSEIQRRLIEHLGMGAARQIDVLVMSGQAILVGFGTYEQAKIAGTTAKSTPGIDGVTNFIVLPTSAND